MRSFRKWNWTIRKKMLIFCFILLIVPMVTVQWMNYLTAKKVTDALIKENLTNSVKLMAHSLRELHKMVENGQLTLEEAQENAKTTMLGPKQQDGTRPITKEVDLGENGYYYVLSEHGDLIAHPSQEGENLWDRKTSDGFYYIQDVIQQGKNGGGFTVYQWPLPNTDKEAPKIVYAMEFPEWNWIIAAGSYYQDFNEGETRIIRTAIVGDIVFMFLGTIAVVLFASRMSRPIAQIAAETRKLAEGDLTSQDLKIRRNDEIGELAKDFNTMKQRLKTMVENVLHSSANVHLASQTLDAAVQNTTQAAKQIAASVEQISSGIEVQASSTDESTRAMEELTAGITRVADTSAGAYDASIRSDHEARQGYELIGQTMEKMKSVERAVADIAKVIEGLNLRSREINDIVNVISDIASQTSLLSLNASIEAARAGEQGRGFAVVALEVKKLAEMSKRSSEQIEQLVQRVQSDIRAASESMMAGLEEVREGASAMEKTGIAFEEIVKSARNVVGQAEEASAAAQEMTASAQQISASLQELDKIAGQSAENTEAISAATEEQIAAMEDLSQSSAYLQRLAAELKSMVQSFKI
jgi:methyl-accepting chemotaxis protein